MLMLLIIIDVSILIILYVLKIIRYKLLKLNLEKILNVYKKINIKVKNKFEALKEYSKRYNVKY